MPGVFWPAITPGIGSTSIEDALALLEARQSGFLPLDGSGQMTGDLRLGGTGRIVWAADTDTYLAHAEDQLNFWAGGVEMLRLVEDAADYVAVGPIGTATVPSVTWITDPNTGLSASVADRLDLIAGGVNMLAAINSTNDQVAVGVAGTATVPALTWLADTDTGLSNTGGDDVLSLVAGGVEMLRLTEAADDQVFLGNFGSATVPTLSRIDDPNTGVSWSAGDTVSVIVGGSEELRVYSAGILVGAVSALDGGVIEAGGAGYQSINLRSTDSSGVRAYLAANAATDARMGSISNHPARIFTNNTQRVDISTAGNVGIGTSTYGTSAAAVLALFNGTAPSTSPADTVQLFSTDISAGNASLGIRTETAVVTAVGASDRYLNIKVNGTTYKLLLQT